MTQTDMFRETWIQLELDFMTPIWDSAFCYAIRG